MSLTDDLKKLVGIKPRYPHVERELAQAYGLAPDVLKEVRKKLLRGAHWDLVKGLVCYNDEGRAALEAALDITSEKNPAEPAPPPAAEPSPSAPAEPPPPPPDSATNTHRGALAVDWEDINVATGPGESRPAIVEVGAPKKFVAPVPGEVRTLVVLAKVRNRRILKARDQDRVAWVRVRDSKNFRPGMQLPAKFLSGEQWEFTGRCPRWLGKF